MRFTYCPYCGTKLEKREIGDEGIIPYCENCKIPLWDMFTTSIICAAVNQYNEIVLLQQDYVSKTNHVCIAGIMKIGESAEETVVREVKEETGLDVGELQFIRTFPYKKKDLLMIGYFARVKKADFVLSSEVDAAEWVPLKDALTKLKKGSIAWQLVERVIEIMEK